MGDSINDGTPNSSWMLDFMENPTKMDDLGIIGGKLL
jgi:hypothetical protein